MSRVIVLMASHINVSERIETMKYALRSLSENTMQPSHVYISCSYEPEIEIDLRIWQKELEDIPCSIFLQDRKYKQFEHYNIIKNYVLPTDIVCFLDDDDLYDPEKIIEVKKYFEKYPDSQVVSHPYYIFGMLQTFSTKNIREIKRKHRAIMREYWTLSMRGFLFIDWFKNTQKYVGNTFEEVIKEIGHLTDLVFACSFPEHQFTEKPLMYIRKETLKKGYGF